MQGWRGTDGEGFGAEGGGGDERWRGVNVCLLLATYSSLLTACSLLLTAHYLLLATFCLLDVRLRVRTGTKGTRDAGGVAVGGRYCGGTYFPAAAADAVTLRGAIH